MGRAAATAGEPSGAFEGLLDEAAVAGAAPADASDATQAKAGQSLTVIGSAGGPATPIATDAQIAAILSADLIAIVDAPVTEATRVSLPQDGKSAPMADQPHEGSDTAEAPLAPDATLADVTVLTDAANITAVAPPIVAAAATGKPAAQPSIIAPVNSATAVTGTDDTPANSPAVTNPALAKAEGDTAPTQHLPKDTELKAAVTAESAEETAPAAAERKGQPSAGKSERRPGISRSPDEHASPIAIAATAAKGPPEEPGKASVAHEAHARLPEHAALAAHVATGDNRADVAAPQSGTAQNNAATPTPPFNLSLPSISHAAMSPLAALRIDVAADNAIPVAGIAVEIVSRAQEGLRRFEIRLDPPELGRIDVRLDVDTAGKVTSRLVVERAETLDLLRRDAPQLERALQQAGLSTEGGMQFSLRDQNFAGREQAARDGAPTRLILPDDETVAAEAARRGYGRLIGLGGGVDIRV